ncbi:MAG: hypothetical protein CVT92_04600 [Bacteroidetes bacterium HGW-Bacteroidetes-1]|jgi:hypothetical protein|nr:MAG: hypothetical protein CVT92_04600 [Bacteroidetes bacterium HGW-Bacteroidetes-1]
MKVVIHTLIIISLFFVSCKKNDNSELKDEKQVLYESNLAFLNSDWTFDKTGDSLKDQIIGLWLSEKVSYDSINCNDCDSLFTWVIESTGIMVTRNNDGGDHGTKYGNWAVDADKKFLFYSYKQYSNAGTLTDYVIMTDTVRIEYLDLPNLWTRQVISNTTKLDVRFRKLNEKI